MKPQDTLILLQYIAINSFINNGEGVKKGETEPWEVKISYRYVSTECGVSVGEVSKAVNRLAKVKMLSISKDGVLVNKHNLTEWMLYGAKYAYSVEKEGYGRGFPTAWNCNLIESEMVIPEVGVAWATDYRNDSDIKAELISPIYPSVPYASAKYHYIHKALALLDILRIGSRREVNIAERLLKEHLMSK